MFLKFGAGEAARYFRYPSILSSYAFDRATAAGRDQGPPSDAAGNTRPVYAPGSGAPDCAKVTGEGTNIVVTVGPIFERPATERKHPIELTFTDTAK